MREARFCYFSQRPEAPQGRISPLSVTGSPISWESNMIRRIFSSSVADHVSEHRGSQACGIGVDQEKQRIIGEQLCSTAE